MKFLRWMAAAILVAAVPMAAAAQTDTGRFSGTVLDQSGAFVPNATVVVRNERTGEERSVVASATGRYIVTGLRPSVYTITIAFEGFAPLEYTGMQLAAAQEFSLDLTLQPAGVSEAVTVQATVTAIDLSSASIGVNVSEREVLSLPVNGRQMSQLMLQAPGSQNAGTGTWNDVRFSGRANQQNVIKFDGVEASAIIDAAPGNIAGQVASPFKLQASLENVQEFRVEANNYPAEYGTGTGGQVSVVTKSGSNAVKGSVFEYFRNDSMSSPNYFDSQRNTDGSVIRKLPQSTLDQSQFGGSIGGPLVRNRTFFFLGYEGYRLDGGLNYIEAAPSAAAWARAVPAVLPLRPAFTAPEAVLLAGASTNPDFDIYQLQGTEEVRENAISLRLDHRLSNNWQSYLRVFHDRGTQRRPQNISGSAAKLTNNPTNAIFNLQGSVGGGLLNEFKIGYNAPKAEVRGSAPTVNGIDFSRIAISTTGSVSATGLNSASTGITVPGGLIRANSATSGAGILYDPYSLAFSDSISRVSGDHLTKLGADVRLINMTFNQLGGTTYQFANLAAFLANTPSPVAYVGDLDAPSVFNGGRGPRHTKQTYFVVFAQDQWNASSNLTLSYGLRYEYYTPLKEQGNRFVKLNIDTGQLESPDSLGGKMMKSRKDSIQPRLAATYSTGKTVFRTGFGIFVGPGQGEDQIQPIESDALRASATSAFPLNTAAIASTFQSNVNNRGYQPRAYANEYSLPERVYQYTASIQRELPWNSSMTAAYVGSQGRNLFLRSVANQIVEVVTNPNPASAAFTIREFSIVNRDANGNITSVQNPYGEVDFKTTGGHDTYNALMLSFNRRSGSGLALNAQYTLGKSTGNSGGSNEADTAANNARTLAQFDYDDGYNKYDVRHSFSASVLYSLPWARDKFYGGWDIGGLLTARSGIPIPVQIARPDILYRDTASGLYYTGPAEGRVAVINTPGGGNSRNVRRPDLVAGVDPYIKNGGLIYLNPAAFAVPQPGTFGNLTRNSIVGPGFQQVDFFFTKRFTLGGQRSVDFRGEVFNLFNFVNFANPAGTLPTVIPSTVGQANALQPGQAYTSATAGSWGRVSSTVGRTVGLGTARQFQVSLRFSF